MTIINAVMLYAVVTIIRSNDDDKFGDAICSGDDYKKQRDDKCGDRAICSLNDNI